MENFYIILYLKLIPNGKSLEELIWSHTQRTIYWGPCHDSTESCYLYLDYFLFSLFAFLGFGWLGRAVQQSQQAMNVNKEIGKNWKLGCSLMKESQQICRVFSFDVAVLSWLDPSYVCCDWNCTRLCLAGRGSGPMFCESGQRARYPGSWAPAELLPPFLPTGLLSVVTPHSSSLRFPAGSLQWSLHPLVWRKGEPGATQYCGGQSVHSSSPSTLYSCRQPGLSYERRQRQCWAARGRERGGGATRWVTRHLLPLRYPRAPSCAPVVSALPRNNLPSPAVSLYPVFSVLTTTRKPGNTPETFFMSSNRSLIFLQVQVRFLSRFRIICEKYSKNFESNAPDRVHCFVLFRKDQCLHT